MSNFKQYMKNVDEELISICEITHECLADFYYHSYFEDGFTPRETAISSLLNEYGFKRLVEAIELGGVNCTYEELLECD